MDGLTVNRTTTPTGPMRSPAQLPAGGAPFAVPALADALALTGGRPTASAPAGGAAPPGASAEQLIAEVVQRLQTAQGSDAQRLTTFAAVVASTANDPQATAALAQAWRNPAGSEGAQRLADLFFKGDETILAHLYYTAAIDDPEVGEELHAAFPNNVFSRDLTGASMLASTVRELYDPQACLQGDRQTCGAASAQILMAREAPSEYVRLVTGLAFEGRAGLYNGGTMTREPDWNADPADKRSLTGQLLQSAFMEYANGQDDYNASIDATRPADNQAAARQGLTSPEMQRLMTAIANRPTDNVQIKDFDVQLNQWVPKPEANLAETIGRIKEMTDKGWSVPVLLSVRPNQQFGHYQLVTRIDGDTVYGLNPWGQEQPMPRALFDQRLITAFFQ
jgi:hypothetical protein